VELGTPSALGGLAGHGGDLNDGRGEAVGSELVDFGAGERPGRASLRLAGTVVGCGDDKQRPAGRGQPRDPGRCLPPHGAWQGLHGDDLRYQVERPQP
jgi:hypothetical protein